MWKDTTKINACDLPYLLGCWEELLLVGKSFFKQVVYGNWHMPRTETMHPCSLVNQEFVSNRQLYVKQQAPSSCRHLSFCVVFMLTDSDQHQTDESKFLWCLRCFSINTYISSCNDSSGLKVADFLLGRVGWHPMVACFFIQQKLVCWAHM